MLHFHRDDTSLKRSRALMFMEPLAFVPASLSMSAAVQWLVLWGRCLDDAMH